MSESANKFYMFEKLLSEVSHDRIKQDILKNATLREIAQIFKNASLDDLGRCAEIATEKNQHELSNHLNALIDRRAVIKDK